MAKKVNKKTKSVAKVGKLKKTAKSARKTAIGKKTVKKAVKNAKSQKSAAKKAVAKKTVPPKKAATAKKIKQQRKSTLSAKELEYYRELLLERLKEIVGSVNHIEAEALKTSRQDSSGDLSSMPIHMADIGSDNYEQEFALGLMDSERKIVQEIYEALKRIQNGTYGVCEGTGEPIPKKRLEGIPWTRYCVEYAEMVEKGLAFESEGAYEEELEEIDDEADAGLEEEIDDEEEDEEDMDLYFYGYDDEEEEDEDELH